MVFFNEASVHLIHSRDIITEVNISQFYHFRLLSFPKGSDSIPGQHGLCTIINYLAFGILPSRETLLACLMLVSG